MNWKILYKDDSVTVRAVHLSGLTRRVIDQPNCEPVIHEYKSCSVRRDPETGEYYIGGPGAPIQGEWCRYIAMDDAAPVLFDGGEE